MVHLLENRLLMVVKSIDGHRKATWYLLIDGKLTRAFDRVADIQGCKGRHALPLLYKDGCVYTPARTVH
jgi:hypothetical protein